MKRLWQSLATHLERSPFWLLVVLMWLTVFVQNGIWVRPNIESLRCMAEDPYRNCIVDIPARHYLYTSYLGVWIAHYLNAYHSILVFAGLHLVELLLGWTCCLYLLRKKYGEFTAKSILVLFVCLPLSNVLVTWLGIGDNLVIIFTCLLVLCPNLGLSFLLAFLLGLSHTEQAGVIWLIFALAAFFRLRAFEQLSPWRKWGRIAAIGLGVLLAHGVLQALFRYGNFDLKETRTSFLTSRGIWVFLEKFFRDPAVTFFSLYLVLWIPVLLLLDSWWRRTRSRALWFLAANALCLAIVALVFDVTRVFALLSWPLVLIAAIEHGAEAQEARQTRRTYLVLALCLALSWVVPKVIMWDGYPHTITRAYDLMALFGKVDFKAPRWEYMPFH